MQGRGEVDAASKITISAPERRRSEVRITQLINDGAIVKKGDFLVQFDTSGDEDHVRRHEESLEGYKAELTSAKARVESNMKELIKNFKTQEYSYEQAEIRLESVKFEAESKQREEELKFKQSGLLLEQAKLRIESQKIIDQADLGKIDVRLKQEELRLNQAIDQLNELTVTAPKDGFVVLHEIYNRSARTREKIKIGDTPHGRMPLLSIPELSKMILLTEVNEVDIPKIQTGQKVLITVDALPGQEFEGTISQIAMLAHRLEGTDVKVFDVNATINNSNSELKPGMTAQCMIITERIPKQLYVPLDSVFEHEDTTVVYVKKNGYERRMVNVGKRNRNYIIINNGLLEGEDVALRDPTVSINNKSEYASIAVQDQ
ncbi:efflux RND transporter periplasmic adaptor subunit [Candidatus Latescibacterota bacterium]